MPLRAREAMFAGFVIWILATACNHSETGPAAEAPCVADTAKRLQIPSTLPNCATSELSCRARCAGGHGPSCLGLAYHLDKDPKNDEEAVRMYRRACSLGIANACTNHAASLWVEKPSGAELACIRRTFEKACSVGEPFACGMVGRVMLESPSPSFAEGRKYLEDACATVGGFSCRVLAMHLESGKLGAYEPGTVRTLLTKACKGGDRDACGGPATAAETFH